MPISIDLVDDEWGSCEVGDRQRVHISPARPVITDPKFNQVVPVFKKVGLVGSKISVMQVTMQKNYFEAGEIVYLDVNIDNSACGDNCSLIVSHRSKIRAQY